MLKFSVLFLFAFFIFLSEALPTRGSGKYNPNPNNSDKKLDSSNSAPKTSLQGKYNPDHDKWSYKHDNRGKYVHVHVPYNGGYGPFKNPYEHDGRPYEHLEPEHKDVFDVQVYTDKAPKLRLEYGAPFFNAAART